MRFPSTLTESRVDEGPGVVRYTCVRRRSPAATALLAALFVAAAAAAVGGGGGSEAACAAAAAGLGLVFVAAGGGGGDTQTDVLTVIAGVGVQVDNGVSRFYPAGGLNSFFVNEAVAMCSVTAYLCVCTEDAAELVLPFRRTEPSHAFIVGVWRDLDACFSHPKAEEAPRRHKVR
eukprot:Rhum_TRINITY_DN12606_c0_g1::Rhum_TRINITY_DN12606_c0_g1_i1::g.53133::m.53133/K03858/PIGH, GPI15; phosphatidylinositol glycan, class H